MNRVSYSELVSFSVEEMFDLVKDVARYPEFLPSCSGSSIIESSDSQMIASINVSRLGITKTFITSNTLIASSSIIMNLIDGPFKILKGGWNFVLLNKTACQVKLELEFEFSNRLIELAFNAFLIESANSIVNAFTKRAKQVYGCCENSS
ncbi:ribosome association toxin [Candidatus Photodesmus katoptron]|uniref:Polyketide cyclase / dehydrase and lipid transport protein n=1 Tax=Candidatus Photodesmus katoptron Akat1 TaxID=1236703 RepID=S3DI39_9GAMM|nr:ubiquinone-binding protein [Candidatus Photodesmus katoptron]EPE37355.1 polyketide cyclase / dehydrase and lipid transport protein [Candidatus Photodesmus katoptron Akat1]KEY89974.1 ribosome association toxin [Candidatus Photodesmus katoptron]